MDINKENEKNIEKMIQKFDFLIKNESLNISNIEELLINNIENYKTNINKFMEELITNKVDEQELISKKNENGKKKDTN